MNTKTRDFGKAKALAQANQAKIPVDVNKEIEALKAAGIPVEEGSIEMFNDDEGFDPFTNPEKIASYEASLSAKAKEAEFIEEQEQAKEETKEVQKPKDPFEIISSMPGGPSKQMLAKWKSDYPEVLFLPLRDDEVYIYRYLTHIEWHKQLLQNKSLIEDEAKLKDAVIGRCLLWPKLDPISMNTQRAGLRDLLYDVIMQSSYFISTDLALNLVRKL